MRALKAILFEITYVLVILRRKTKLSSNAGVNLLGIRIPEARQIQERGSALQRSAHSRAREGVRKGRRSEQDNLDACWRPRREQGCDVTHVFWSSSIYEHVIHVWCCFQGKEKDKDTSYGDYGGWHKSAKVDRYYTQNLFETLVMLWIRHRGFLFLQPDSYDDAEELGSVVSASREVRGCWDVGGVCTANTPKRTYHHLKSHSLTL